MTILINKIDEKKIIEMADKKNDGAIKLLYDGTILCSISNAAYVRGIYYVAYELFKKFVGDDRFEVTIWMNQNYSIEPLKNNELYKNIPIVFSNFCIDRGDKSKLVKNPKFDKNEYDVYFNVGHDSQLMADNQKPTIFNVLHDCIPVFKKYNFFEGTDYPEYFYEFYHSLTKDTYTFCVSQNTKKDFLENFDNFDEEKMQVSYIAPVHNLTPKKEKNIFYKMLQKYNIQEVENAQYIFFLGAANDPRKNLVYTINCFFKFLEKYHIDNLYFYIGGYGKNTLKQKLVAKCGTIYEKYKDKIVFLGFISEEDVNLLYSNSLFFSFLSLYEGFGIPPLEAMQAGTPVVCANNSSLPEVVGDAAILVDSEDEDEIINSYAKLYFDEKLRREYIQKGLERAKLFSWDKTYKIISDKIIKVVSGEKNE